MGRLKPFRPVEDTPAPTLVELSVLERVLLLQVLPAEGNLLTVRSVKAIRDAVEFGDEEQDRIKMKVIGQQIAWDPKLADEADREVAFSARGLVVIEDALKALETKSALRPEYLTLWDKFVPDPE